jgi:hypothetical protein
MANTSRATIPALILALVLCAGAAAQTPPERPDERRRLATGATPIVAETVAPGETFLTIPYEFRRAGVLKADLVGSSFLYKGVKAPAGTVGLWVNAFWSESRTWSGSLSKSGGDVWCFYPPPEDAKKPLCLMVGPEKATVLPLTNPYEIEDGVALLGDPQFVTLPQIEENSVRIPGDQRRVYHFVGWKRGFAQIEGWDNGRKMYNYRLPQRPDGSARLWTFVGEYWLSPVPGDPTRARVSGPPAAPATTGAAPP